MKDNKGFSLVELIISIAILSVVSLMIVGFLATSSNTYTSVSNDLSLQYEAQTVFGQMQEYIIDCNTAVAYDDVQKALYIITYGEPTGPEETGYVIHSFRLDEDDGTFYYGYSAVNREEGSSTVVFAITEYQQSTHIKDFSCSVTDTSVEIKLSFTKNRKSYEASQLIAMRNPITSSYTSDLGAVVSAVCV